MGLEAGQRVGTFEILSRLGVGGMGEVYRARDTHLGREVAIKLLAPAVADDADRLVRFEREARALASLSHPNVGAIHGAEEADGLRFLVLELIPGDTLADRVARGPLTVDEALRLGCQIAAGVEAAHERGIVHRDLKPANVKITPDGRIKVLDFGLARMLSPSGDSGATATVADHQTQHGIVLGTPTYMSPEQARGQAVDKRTDVWAFGCLLYEMLTGRKAFAGETVTDVLAGILSRDPDWQALPAGTPRAVKALLVRCLQRDRERRLHDIADARIELEEVVAGIASGTIEARIDTPMSRRQALALVGGGVAAGAAAAGGGFALWRRFQEDAPALRYNVAIPARSPLLDVFSATGALALSPDGRSLAFVAQGAAPGIWIRSLQATQARLLPGTSGASTPFFSPDGKWVGFFSNNMIRKTHVDSGEPQAVCPAGRMRGAGWGDDGRIVFGVFSNALMAVNAAAGSPQPLTTLDPAQAAVHRWPEVLPDGNGVLFALMTGNQRNVAAVGPDGGDLRVLVEGGNCPRYLRGGYLLFARTGTLMAAPFDLRSRRVTAPPVPVVEDVRMVSKGSGGAHYAVSRSGALAYVPGYPRPPLRSLVWVDRAGRLEPLSPDNKPYASPRFAPDGKRLVVMVDESEQSDLWTYEIERGTWTRVTFEGDNTQPVWSPDGRRIAFSSNRDGTYQLYVVNAEGGPARQVTRGREWRFPTSFAPDGRHLACNQTSDQKAEVVVVDVDGAGQPIPLGTRARYEGAAMFSPDGKWIAYLANEGSGYEVLVTEAAGGGRRWTISGGDAAEPMWSPDSRELFYRVGHAVYAVDVQLGPQFTAGKPRQLFSVPLELGNAAAHNWDVAPQGGRFLAVRSPSEEHPPLEVVYVPDFAAEVAAKLRG